MLFPRSMGQGASSDPTPLTLLLQGVSFAGQKTLSSRHPLLGKHEKSQDRDAGPLSPCGCLGLTQPRSGLRSLHLWTTGSQSTLGAEIAPAMGTLHTCWLMTTG